ncbi:hypothetical protein AA700_1249 [Acidiphilium acidophilum DSM 700]|nr:hypothetical protein AA700_1249 [Acidiphilium acidophilum DSM 700]
MFIGIDNALGICINTDRSDPPYSSNKTETPASSDNRAANTHPAEPAPTTT